MISLNSLLPFSLFHKYIRKNRLECLGWKGRLSSLGFQLRERSTFQKCVLDESPGKCLDFRCKSAVKRSLPCTLSSQTGRQTVATEFYRALKIPKTEILGKSRKKWEQQFENSRIIHVYRTYHTKRKANMGFEVPPFVWDSRMKPWTWKGGKFHFFGSLVFRGAETPNLKARTFIQYTLFTYGGDYGNDNIRVPTYGSDYERLLLSEDKTMQEEMNIDSIRYFVILIL